MNTTLAKIAAATVLGLTLTASAVQAGGPPPHSVNARQAEQRARIRQGVRSGELTYAERVRLQAREAQIRRQEARYRLTHGRISAAERARLERELNQTSRVIYKNKNDRQDRHDYHHH